MEPRGRGPGLPAACLETASWRGSGLELNSAVTSRTRLSPTQAGAGNIRQLPPGSGRTQGSHDKYPLALPSCLAQGSAAGTKAPQQRGRWKLAPLTLGPEADSPGRVQEAPVPNALSSQSRLLVPARRTEGGGEGSASLS